MEIEKKYLIEKLPDNFTYNRKSKIYQTYLNDITDSFEVRLRHYDHEDRYYLDLKSNGVYIRDKKGIKISKEQYDILNIEKQLVKMRYYTDEFLIDIFEGLNLIIAEVENEKLDNFIKPSWFGEEVTFNEKYKNRYLFDL